MYDKLLPHPREFGMSSGTSPVASFNACRVCGLSEETMNLLEEDFPGITFEEDSRDAFFAVIGPEDDELRPNEDMALGAPEGEQGFLLDVDSDRVEIHARDAAGLWYGIQAFYQMRRHDEIPTGEIRDWPAVKYRGVHIDLKGYQFHFRKLIEMCHLLSRYRVNAILLEVEDKFDYACAPEVGVPGSYTAYEFKQLGKVCRALHIELIPKIQTLGHVDYILRHEKYAHLREKDHAFQFCPRNEESLRLWKDMADELIECFPGHQYFHVGSDETANLGECDVCREHSKASSYIHRVGQCIDHIIERDLTPIMWEDILRNAHHNLSEEEVRDTWALGKQCVLNYWVYGSQFTLDHMDAYLAADMKVWGASAMSGAGPTMIEDYPPLADRASNMSLWTEAAVKYDLEGIIATSWTKFRSADPPAESFDASWITALYSAESTWWGQDRDLDEFLRVASEEFWGIDVSDDILDFLLTHDVRALPESLPQAPRNNDRLQLLLAAMRFQAHRKLRDDVAYQMHMYHRTLGDALPDYIVNHLRHMLKNYRRSIATNRDLLRSTLDDFYSGDCVEDVILSRFGRDEKIADELESLLDSTRLV
jgi:hexosaminidase